MTETQTTRETVDDVYLGLVSADVHGFVEYADDDHAVDTLRSLYQRGRDDALDEAAKTVGAYVSVLAMDGVAASGHDVASAILAMKDEPR